MEAGLSRKEILFELDESLRRLGTDYIDLYQTHRWDYRDSDRGDAGGVARCGEGGQGAVYRSFFDVLRGSLRRRFILRTFAGGRGL